MGNTFGGGIDRHDDYPGSEQPQHVHTVSHPPPQPFKPRRPSANRAPVTSPGPEYAYHSSVASTDIHKGLHNETAAYHCFLNVRHTTTTHGAPLIATMAAHSLCERIRCAGRQVIIQSLWHLLPFRHRLISLDYTHRHKHEPCVFCALRSVFTQYEHSESVIIPPDELRLALHEIDSKEGGVRFALGSQGDAEEALDEILRWLHSDHVTGDTKAGQSSEDVTCVPPCISHAVFGAQCMDVKVCRCGATSDPDSSTSFLYRVYVSDLLAMLSSTNLTFAAILKSIYRSQAYSCPTNALSPTSQPCRGPALIDRWLLTPPIVFTLMLAWQPQVSRPEIEQIWGSLPATLRLTDFLRYAGDSGTLQYDLQGVVCYYGRHYLAFFWSAAYGGWLMFDDRRVFLVGGWEELCQRACAGKLQPILVFYLQPGGMEALHSPRELAKSMQTEWMKKKDEEELKLDRAKEQEKEREKVKQDSVEKARKPAPALPNAPPRAATSTSASASTAASTSASSSASASASQLPFSYGSPPKTMPSSSSSSGQSSSTGRTSSVKVSGASQSPVDVEHDVFFGLQPFSYTASHVGGTKRR